MEVQKKIQIAVIISSNKLPLWQSKLISDIAQSGFTELKLILNNQIQDNKDSNATFIGRLLYRLHTKLDSLIYGTKSSAANLISIENFIKERKLIELNHAIDTEEISSITDAALDVIINLGHHIVPNEVLNCSQYGVWSLANGDYRASLQITPGYQETTEYHPETISSIQILGENHANDKLLYASSQITDYHSIDKNQNKLAKRNQLLLFRVLENLHQYGKSYLDECLEKHKNADFNKPNELSKITAFKAIKGFYKHLNTLLFSLYKNTFFLDYWFLKLQLEKDEAFSRNYQAYQTLDSPKSVFWADPFVISRGDNYYLFVEELPFKTNKGHLSAIVLDKKGKILDSKIILDKPYHLSYPYMLRHEGEDYMIPETNENNSIDLYKCVNFPFEWEFEKHIMTDIHAVDATPFYHNSKWWLFANVDKLDGNSSINDELFLFYADDIKSDNWKSHPQNPIISDVKRARPAGKIFVEDGKIFRPSQDCSSCYGNALNLNQIITLNETQYEEILISKSRLDWDKNLKRLHTLNHDNGISIIDTFRYKSKFFG